MCTMLQRVHAQWLVKVLSCHNLSGRYDYQLEVVGVDLDSFAEFVRIHIRALPGVREISTSFRSQRLSGLVGCLLLRGTSITLLRQSKSSFHCPSKQRLNRFKIRFFINFTVIFHTVFENLVFQTFRSEHERHSVV